jgi:hypothetical protein
LTCARSRDSAASRASDSHERDTCWTCRTSLLHRVFSTGKLQNIWLLNVCDVTASVQSTHACAKVPFGRHWRTIASSNFGDMPLQKMEPHNDTRELNFQESKTCTSEPVSHPIHGSHQAKSTRTRRLSNSTSNTGDARRTINRQHKYNTRTAHEKAKHNA